MPFTSIYQAVLGSAGSESSEFLLALYLSADSPIRYRIRPYLQVTTLVNSLVVAMAATTGLEPATSSVTDWRALQLLHAAISAPTGAICIRLDFE